jgi:F-type H+-transporting ATPase subunit a
MASRLLRSALPLGVVLATAGPALASDGGGEVHPTTWLDFLARVRIAGHPLVSNQAALAFAWSLVACVALVLISVLGTRRISLRPGKFQLLLETLVGAMRGMVASVMGPRGVEFVPFIGALFIYIAAMNLLGLVPGAMAGTANLSVTAGLAVVVFCVVHYVGFRRHGLRYLDHFVEGVPKRLIYLPLLMLIFVVHVVSELVRPVTLALRLFGNMFAGETVILILIGLMAPLYLHHRIPIPVQLPNMLLEVLIAVVQAMVFSMLAVVYLAGVVETSEAEY